MGLFSRKKSEEEFEKLPELPQLPQLPESINSQNLQSSQQESAKRWSMQAVKDAVGSSDVRDNEDNNFDKLVSSGDEGVMGTPRVPFNIGQSTRQNMGQDINMGLKAQMPARREPLFVRIDKFEAALRDFEDISIKIKRIEELITEIRELREKEDREFEEWEKDLQVMRSRMDDIDRTLFSQMD